MSEEHPNILVFNPTCEYAIANGNENWQPNQLLQKMEADLSLLLIFLSEKTDFVVVEKLPSDEFLVSLQQINIDIPNFILKNAVASNQYFVGLPKNKLLPWGWSPAVHKLLSPLKASCSSEFQQSPIFKWKPVHREITSRKFAAEILKQIQTTLNTDYILPLEFLPKVCTTINDFEAAIHQWGKIMIKAPWSSSGRGLQPISKTPVHPKVWEKVMGIVKDQGYAIAEPLLDKVHDLALLFELKKEKVEYLGISNFCTNSKGQYEGNFLNGLPSTIEKSVSEFIEFVAHKIRQPIINAMETSKMAANYEGVFGIDTLIYTDKSNRLRINPCLEINVRHTMGLLALRIEKLIHQNKTGMYRTYYKPGTSFYTFKKEMEKKHPLKIKRNKIESGFLALTEAKEDSLFGAYILI